MGPPEGGPTASQVHLLQALVLFLLVADVLAYQFLVTPYRGYEVASRPKVLSDEIAFPLPVHPCHKTDPCALDLYQLFYQFRVFIQQLE